MSENNKTKKILFTILIIAVIAALGLIAYQYSGYRAGTEVQKGTETEESKTEESVEKIPPVAQEPEEIANIINKAIRNQDASLCEDLNDETRKSECKREATSQEQK